MTHNVASLDIGGVEPHGGQLIDRQLRGNERKEALERARGLPQVPLSPVNVSDLEMIATGAYSPLTGFMGRSDYKHVVDEMHLTNGTIWPLPITLPVANDLADKIKEGQEVALVQGSNILALMEIAEKYSYDKELEAERVYQTNDIQHPGVGRLYRQSKTLLAGEIWCLNRPRAEASINLYRETPFQSRRFFISKGWKTVAGFQTRNPLYRAHEFIMERTLECVDGLFLHPLVGTTKSDDISAATRFKCYEVVVRNFLTEHIRLSAFPAAMRYAGPREALFHALCRKNYGCTHFVVGRDHAGVGGYYAADAACNIFKQFSAKELGIEILEYPKTFYCSKCGGVATHETYAHIPDQYGLSGTTIREMLSRGETPPEELMRPQVSAMLMAALGLQSDNGISYKTFSESSPLSEHDKNQLLERLLCTTNPTTRLTQRHLLRGDIKPGPVSISEVLALETNQLHPSRAMNRRGS